MYRIGLGSDIHRFENGRPLMLGGVEIPSEQGLAGHSDGDVVLHAVGSALLGACALGDLGTFFPPDEENEGRESREILHEICLKVWDRGYKVVNADIVVMCEQPRIAPYRQPMTETIATLLGIEPSQVGVKATTCEGLGAIGRGEGIFAQAVVLLNRVINNE